MIVPKYWAEARLQHRERRRQVTVRRFGWSDLSLEQAQAHAEARVADAMAQIRAGVELARRERRVAYNGADGLPIREEVVQREGESVITRNGYGALCLNTPNVLFADIDFVEAPDWRLRWTLTGVLALAFALALGSAFGQGWGSALVGGLLLGLIVGGVLSRLLFRSWMALSGGVEGLARRRIQRFVERRPDWRLHVYRTPAGLRLLAMHRLFDPREPEVAAAFEALGVDADYARMCRNQNCFRARLTPKPWRIGLPRLRSPYAAAWRPEHADLPARRSWVAKYERASQGFAACRHVDTLGSGQEHAAAAQVRQLHDSVCKSASVLPLA